MPKKYIFVIIFAALFICGFATDIKQYKLSVDDAVAIGLQNSRDLKIETINLDDLKLSAISSYNEVMPSLTMNGGLYKYETDPDLILKFNFNMYLSLNASSFFQIYNSILNYKNGKIQFESAKKIIENGIKKNYYNILFLLEQKKLTSKYVDSIAKRVKYTENMYNQEIVPKIYLIKSQHTLDMSKIDLKNMEDQYEYALIQFKYLLGLNPKDEVELNNDFDNIADLKPVDIEKIEMNKLNNTYELQNIILSINAMKNIRNTHIAEMTPSLNLEYDYTYGYQSNYDRNYFEDDNYLYFSVSLPIDSWLPFSKVQTELLQSQNKIKKLNLDYERKYEEIKFHVSKTAKSANNNLRNAKLLSKDVTISEEIFDLSSKLYEIGQRTLLELESYHKDYIDTTLSYLNAIYNYKTQVMDLEYLGVLGDN